MTRKKQYRCTPFIAQLGRYARKGYSDEEIAAKLGLTPQAFSQKRAETIGLNELLERERGINKGLSARARRK